MRIVFSLHFGINVIYDFHIIPEPIRHTAVITEPFVIVFDEVFECHMDTLDIAYEKGRETIDMVLHGEKYAHS